jgi:hypothetical protein
MLECFSPGRSFKPSLMFVGKAKSLSQSGAPEGCFTRVDFSLTPKHWNRLGGPTRANILARLFYKKIFCYDKTFHSIVDRQEFVSLRTILGVTFRSKQGSLTEVDGSEQLTSLY